MLPTAALVLTVSLFTPPPATLVIFACSPALTESPDRSNDKPWPMLTGQVFLLAVDGTVTTAGGDLYVMLETEAKGVDGKKLFPEVFHFDPKTLAKLRAKDERFRDCYAVFLP